MRRRDRPDELDAPPQSSRLLSLAHAFAGETMRTLKKRMPFDGFSLRGFWRDSP
jgi:hypothetical protein